MDRLAAGERPETMTLEEVEAVPVFRYHDQDFGYGTWTVKWVGPNPVTYLRHETTFYREDCLPDD